MSNILKLQTNIPLTLTPKYADYADGKFGRQLAIKADNGDRVYLPDALLGEFVKAGVLVETDDLDPKTNHPRLRVLKTATVTLLRTEEGTRKHTTVTVGGSAAPPQPQRNGAAPTPSPRQPAAPAEPPGVTFERLCLTMGRCLFRAMKQWEEQLAAFRAVAKDGVRANGPDWDVIASTAHSLFIAADKRGLLASLPQREAGQEG